MKKTSLISAVSVLVALIVLPVIHSVNLLTDAPAAIVPTLSADGWPLPLPTPPFADSALVADGWPLPLPTPPFEDGALVADGWPLPLPTPPFADGTLVADGWPLPLPTPPFVDATPALA